MQLILDTIHECQPLKAPRKPCRFRLRLFQASENSSPVVALATVLWEGPAPSVINYVEAAATDVWQKVVKPRLPNTATPERDFVWVHQVPAYGPVDEDESTSLWPEHLTRVTLSWEGDVAPVQTPHWETNIDRSIIEVLTGQQLPMEPPRGH